MKVELFPKRDNKMTISSDIQGCAACSYLLFKKKKNIWKNLDHYEFTGVLCQVPPRCYSGIAFFVLRATGQGFTSAEKQFRYRAWVCYCVWGGLRRSVVLGPGRQECAETIRMRYLELRHLNTKRPAAWQVEPKHFGTVPSLSERQMGLNFTNCIHAVTWVKGNNGECATSTHRWDWAHWGQFWRLFIPAELTCFCDKCLCWTGTRTIHSSY